MKPIMKRQRRPIPILTEPATQRELPAKFFTPFTSSSLSQPSQKRDTKPPIEYESLDTLLTAEAYNPSDVWALFAKLQVTPGVRLPLEIYRETLRKCSPPPGVVKSSLALPLRNRKLDPRSHPNPYYRRLRAVLDSMKIAGHQPDVDDYNHLLEHMEAVGDYQGSLSLLKEMRREEVSPSSESLNICFRMLCFYASYRLPMDPTSKGPEDIQRAFVELTDIMKNYGIDQTADSLAAMVYIHKLNKDVKGIERCLRLGFGVDLDNPDHHPPEFIERMQSLAKSAKKAGLPPPIAPSVPSALLTTIIAAFGENGMLGKMVTAFEVLTAPLPLPDVQSPPSPDLSEDDDPVFHDHLQPSPLSPVTTASLTPSKAPRPSTATYEALLRHSALHKNKNLVKHYLLAAMDRDRQVSLELRTGLQSGVGPIHRSAVAVTRTMLKSASVLKDPYLNNWIREQARTVNGWKARDMRFLRKFTNKNLVKMGLPIRRTDFEHDDKQLYPSQTHPERFFKPFNKDLHLSILDRELLRIRDFIQELEGETPASFGKLNELRRVKKKVVIHKPEPIAPCRES